MSDQRIRELERQAAAGDPQARRALTRAQRRVGVSPPDLRYWLLGRARRIWTWSDPRKRKVETLHLVGANARGWNFQLDYRNTDSRCGRSLETLRWRQAKGQDIDDGFRLSERERMCKTCWGSLLVEALDRSWWEAWAWQVAWAYDTLRSAYPMRLRYEAGEMLANEPVASDVEQALGWAEAQLAAVGLFVSIDRLPRRQNHDEGTSDAMLQL